MLNSRPLSATLAGMGAILLWSTSLSVSRLVTEPLGPLTAGASIYLLAGAVGCSALLARRSAWRLLRGVPAKYLGVCGGLFVAYTVCLYEALGLATGREQVLAAGVINYLWPGLTLAFSVPLLGLAARPTLPLGVGMGFVGVALAMIPSRHAEAGVFWRSFLANGWPYLLALAAAVAWALYSNLLRRWAGPGTALTVPVFLLASGLAMAGMALLAGETPRFAARAVGLAAYQGLGPALAGYLLWERGVRRGYLTVLASAAYLIPLLSVVIGAAVLGVRPGPGLVPGAVLVVAAAIVCKLSVRERP